MRIATPVATMIESLQRLPGIGPRSAEKLTYFLLRMSSEDVFHLAENLKELKLRILICNNCFNISEQQLCSVCLDPTRDGQLILVVEEPLDVIALEKAGNYKGVYHVLGGIIDPTRGIGPNELRINELMVRISRQIEEKEGVLEIILATNPSTEGETTAIYLKKILSEKYSRERLKITRIARGLPMGADLEYADSMTLSRALEERRDY